MRKFGFDTCTYSFKVVFRMKWYYLDMTEDSLVECTQVLWTLVRLSKCKFEWLMSVVGDCSVECCEVSFSFDGTFELWFLIVFFFTSFSQSNHALGNNSIQTICSATILRVIIFLEASEYYYLYRFLCLWLARTQLRTINSLQKSWWISEGINGKKI